MKKAFSIALSIFKYILIVFGIFFMIWMVYDDWSLIQRYGATHLPLYLVIWFCWFLLFALWISIYYWGIAFLLILIYYKVFKPLKKKIF